MLLTAETLSTLRLRREHFLCAFSAFPTAEAEQAGAMAAQYRCEYVDLREVWRIRFIEG